jgi:itaconate CoA-transferase
MLPLQDITVVALEQAVAVPFATRQLADLGARVIKIERPEVGDFARAYDKVVHGESSHFVWLNRGKESLTLDVKHEEAENIFHKLLSKADVFIQNLAPGASNRLGLSAAELTQKYPRLIVCDLSGYGRDGPYGDKKAYDLLVQCETGVVSVTGTKEAPAKSGISVADIAGGMYAFSGILTALYQRERTGKGTSFEVTLFEALGEWMSYPAYYAAYSGKAPPRSGAAHAVIFPYGPFDCGDGKTVFFGIQNEREWDKFCRVVLQQPDLGNDPRFTPNPKRIQNQAELEPIINKVLESLTSAQVLERLDEAQIANARLNSPLEFWNHPQHAARNRKRTVNTPSGPVDALLPPVQLAGMEARMGAIPDVGEQSHDILAELGYDDSAIEKMRSTGAI